MKERLNCVIRHRYSKFATGGIIVFFFEWLLTIMLTEIFYFDHNLSYIFSLLLGILLLFGFHEKITFQTNIVHRQFVLKKFFWLYSLVYVINWVLVFYISNYLSYVIAIPLVTISLSFILYPLTKRWIFRCD